MEFLRACAAEEAGWRFVPPSGTSGQRSALKAGLERARDDWVVTLAAELQPSPERMAEMVERTLEALELTPRR